MTRTVALDGGLIGDVITTVEEGHEHDRQFATFMDALDRAGVVSVENVKFTLYPVEGTDEFKWTLEGMRE